MNRHQIFYIFACSSSGIYMDAMGISLHYVFNSSSYEDSFILFLGAAVTASILYA